MKIKHKQNVFATRAKTITNCKNDKAVAVKKLKG